MAKPRPPKKAPPDKVDIIIESDQWESPSPPRFTWRHGFILGLIVAVGILFAFGFLIIAGILLLAILVVQIFMWIVRSLP